MKKYEKWLLNEKYGGEKSPGFFADCERLAAGEPLGYVIGWTPFLDCKIWLDNHPLIPRPETEFWVEHTITSIQQTFHSNERFAEPVTGLEQPEQVGPVQNLNRSDLFRSEREVKVLDLCAGSGAIGVAVAKAVPEVRVDLAEIDAHLLPTIAKNIRDNLSVNRKVCRVLESDLFQTLSTEQQYDFILSNPPYIDPALDRTEVSVKNYEPHQALYGGQNGLELIQRIVAGAPPYLTPGGQLWLEHEPEQADAIMTLAHQHGFSVTTHTDQYNVPRYSILTVAQ